MRSAIEELWITRMMRDFEVEEAFPSILIKQKVIMVVLNNDIYQRIVLV